MNAPQHPVPNPASSQSFIYNDLIVVLGLFCCSPVGLILMWAGNKWSKPVRIGITVAWGLLFGISLISSLAIDRPARATSSTEASERTAPEPKRAEVEFIEETCESVSTKFGASSKLSEVQKEELWKAYKGKGFAWPLEVSEVHSGVLGGYSVQFKCSPSSPSLIFDIQVEYPESAKNVVLQFQKGETYETRGILTRSGSILGLSGKAIAE